MAGCRKYKRSVLHVEWVGSGYKVHISLLLLFRVDLSQHKSHLAKVISSQPKENSESLRYADRKFQVSMFAPGYRLPLPDLATDTAVPKSLAMCQRKTRRYMACGHRIPGGYEHCKDYLDENHDGGAHCGVASDKDITISMGYCPSCERARVAAGYESSIKASK